MPEQALVGRQHLSPGRAPEASASQSPARAWPVRAWPLVVLAVLVCAIAWVVLTRMRPSFDAYGWLVWGKQVLHWNLNTDGAPSWKPLTFLFTLPYALLGNAQVSFWMVTASAGALAGAVIGAHIAYRLTGPSSGRRWAPWAAALFAGAGVLGISGLSHLVLIANSDPIDVALCLAAIDAHLCGRRRLAFGLIVLESLGRPEAWAFSGLYGLWLLKTMPSMRVWAVLALLLIPVCWFSVPALTSHSWFTPGDLALNSQHVIHGDKLTGVFGRFFGLYEWPMRLAWIASVVLALVRRDRTWLGLIGAALLWVFVEIGFALHGWSAVDRYLIEPAAVMVVLAGATVGLVLAGVPSPSRAPSRPAPLAHPGPSVRSRAHSRRGAWLRWAGVALVLALVVSLIPTVRQRLRLVHAQIDEARIQTIQIQRLQAVIAADGGAARIRDCGQPVSLLGFQSILAWAIGENVGNIGFKPGRAINSGKPIVYFKPYRNGWQVRPSNMSGPDAAACNALRTDSSYS
jgi:hypothetical protein